MTESLEQTIVIKYIGYYHYAFPVGNGRYDVESHLSKTRPETKGILFKDIKKTVQLHTVSGREVLLSIDELERRYPWEAWSESSSALDVLDDIAEGSD